MTNPVLRCRTGDDLTQAIARGILESFENGRRTEREACALLAQQECMHENSGIAQAIRARGEATKAEDSILPRILAAQRAAVLQERDRCALIVASHKASAAPQCCVDCTLNPVLRQITSGAPAPELTPGLSRPDPVAAPSGGIPDPTAEG